MSAPYRSCPRCGAAVTGHASRAHILAHATRIDEPAMPPARCAPGCTPTKSCRIVIPVTDQGTRYECPAFAEDKIKPGRLPLADWERKWADRQEARAMRDQRWEPATPMVGRYVYDRRPR